MTVYILEGRNLLVKKFWRVNIMDKIRELVLKLKKSSYNVGWACGIGASDDKYKEVCDEANSDLSLLLDEVEKQLMIAKYRLGD